MIRVLSEEFHVKIQGSVGHLVVIVQLGFLLLALIWKFDFSPFMVLIIAILNDGMSASSIFLICETQRVQ